MTDGRRIRRQMPLKARRQRRRGHTPGDLPFIFATMRYPEDWRFARRRGHLVCEQAVLLRR